MLSTATSAMSARAAIAVVRRKVRIPRKFSRGAGGASSGSNLAVAVISAFMGNSGPGKVPGKVPGFANGVTNFSGGLAVVGEKGFELVELPQGANV